ncbi:Putative structural protein [Tsukamurella phage TPA4]|uniref:putative structural protein n=1 Tax=Tsukamurella phage TPA4 TaxID=1647476 RepID=UPI0007B615C3|nr:putative structural protein [Tsukamurella phage TPA4]AKJ72189.1 Putative structural protein [Tsukamurella phage TPA4]
MPASFEVRGPVITHDPTARLDQTLPIMQNFDVRKLAEQLLNFFIERMEEIPVLGVVVKALRQLLDTNQDGDITLEDLVGLFTGRGVLDALASLFGGANGMSLTSIVEGLKKLFSGLTPGGQFDARRLFGIIFPWLIPSVPYQHLSDESLNLVAEHDFAEAITIEAGVTGFTWDGAHGYDPDGTGVLGCAAVTGNGTEQALTMLTPVAVSKDQVLRLAGRASWQWVTGTVPAGAQLVLDTFNAGAPVARVPVASLAVSGTQPVWQQLTGEWTVPTGVDSVAVTLLVPAALADGTVRFDRITLHKVQKMKLEWTGKLVERFQFLAALFNNPDTDLDGIVDPEEIWNALWSAVLKPLQWIPVAAQNIIDRIVNAWKNLGNLVDIDQPGDDVLGAVFGIFKVGLNANTRAAAVEARIRALESAANSIVIDFNGSSSSSLGGGWSQTYSGGGAGTLGLDGQGNAVWQQFGGFYRACIARYTAGAPGTDAQRVEWVLASSPQSPIFDPGYTYVGARADAAMNNYVRVRIGYDTVRMQAMVGGSLTDIGPLWSGYPAAGDVFEWMLGEPGGTNLRHHVLKRNGAVILDFTETVSVTGASNRSLMCGMEAGNRLVFFQNVPAGLGVLTGAEVL